MRISFPALVVSGDVSEKMAKKAFLMSKSLFWVAKMQRAAEERFYERF
jgi:hypothetical protein